MFFVYVLTSKEVDKFYIGQTKDLDKRLAHHNHGLDAFTRKYLPWKLVFSLPQPTRTDALQLEKKLKNLSRERLLAFIEKYKSG